MPASVLVLFAFMLLIAVAASVALRQREGTGSSRGRRSGAGAEPVPIGHIAIAPALRRLLEALERVGDEDPALLRSATRELLRDVLDQAFVVGRADPEWPESFGLGSAQAEGEVRRALAAFLKETRPMIGEEGLATPQERLRAFEHPALATARGSIYGTFFGFS